MQEKFQAIQPARQPGPLPYKDTCCSQRATQAGHPLTNGDRSHGAFSSHLFFPQMRLPPYAPGVGQPRFAPGQLPVELHETNNQSYVRTHGAGCSMRAEIIIPTARPSRLLHRLLFCTVREIHSATSISPQVQDPSRGASWPTFAGSAKAADECSKLSIPVFGDLLVAVPFDIGQPQEFPLPRLQLQEDGLQVRS